MSDNRGAPRTRSSIRFPGMLGLVGVAVLSACSPFSRDAAAPANAAAKTGSDEAPARNVANDRILSLTKQQQARILGSAVGKSCVGKSAFFMGLGDEGSAFWSVRCANGRTYVVAIAADDAGTTSSASCSTFKAKAHVDCFKKF